MGLFNLYSLVCIAFLPNSSRHFTDTQKCYHYRLVSTYTCLNLWHFLCAVALGQLEFPFWIAKIRCYMIQNDNLFCIFAHLKDALIEKKKSLIRI